MKTLKDLIPLNHKTTIFIPATVNIDKPIDNTKQVEEAAKLLSQCFGGATSSPALGFWVSENNSLIKEKTTIVFAYANEKDFNENIDKIVAYCEALKDEMGQEAIAFEVDNAMYFL